MRYCQKLFDSVDYQRYFGNKIIIFDEGKKVFLIFGLVSKCINRFYVIRIKKGKLFKNCLKINKVGMINCIKMLNSISD